MDKVIKLGVLGLASAGIIYFSYTMYQSYVKKQKQEKDKIPPIPFQTKMGNIGCIQPPCM
jgi:hypothetical protein